MCEKKLLGLAIEFLLDLTPGKVEKIPKICKRISHQPTTQPHLKSQSTKKIHGFLLW